MGEEEAAVGEMLGEEETTTAAAEEEVVEEADGDSEEVEELTEAVGVLEDNNAVVRV